MPKWEDYKAEAKSRGALAFELFVVQSTPAAEPATIKSVLPDHLAYIKSLEASGQVALAGPLSDETGEEMQAMGMLILRAANFEEARTLAANDPMHKTGARTFTLRKWMVNEGSFSLTVKFAGQNVELH